MKNIPLHIEENELDQLLRQFVLDGGSDEFTQNTLTMNADMIFNSPAATLPGTAREIALIQQLERDFIKRRGFGKFWLNAIIFLFIISAALWIYKTNRATPTTALQTQQNGKNNFQPVIAGDTADEANGFVAQETSVQNSIVLFPQDSVYADTLAKQSPPKKKERYATPDSHMPIEPYWYEGNYVVTEVPGPVFSAKASPENYKRLQDTFHVRSDNQMFACKQSSFFATYYSGEPFKSGMNDLQYFNYGEYAQLSEKEETNNGNRAKTANRWTLPWAVLEYADPQDVKVETVNLAAINRSYDWLFLYKIPEKGIQLAMGPFYFRKYEVTNKEYREFVNWVRASNGYADKPIFASVIDTIEVTDPKDHTGEQVTLKGKNYRIVRKTTPTEDYREVYNYIFFNAASDAVQQLGKKSLYVLPDTAAWTTDFTYSFNEPMSNMYFWHPAYDGYPVVGVSWYQAMAFLDWKTHMHQKQLDKENIAYEIEYTLPSDIEWGLASVSFEIGKLVMFDNYYETTQDWMSNLGLSYGGKDDPYQRPNYLKNLFTKDQYFRGDYIRDGYFHTGQADLSGVKNAGSQANVKHLDEMGISWMDGNVSEWMAESYSQNWQPFFEKHLAVLSADTSEATNLAKQIEILYNKGNAANGRLVRGANWYDERFAGRPGSTRNDAGMNPKRYVDPSAQHCTLGFRYVIHVKRK